MIRFLLSLCIAAFSTTAFAQAPTPVTPIVSGSPVSPSNPLPVTGSAGNGLVQTTPPSYSNGASEPPTLQKDGSVITNGSAIIGTFTCSATCNTTNAGVLATFNMWNYNVLSFDVSVTDASLVELLCDDGSGNFQIVPDMKVYNFSGSTSANQEFINTQGLYQTPSIIASRCELFFFTYNGSTVTITVRGGNSAAPVQTVIGSVNATPTDVGGNASTPAVVCGSAVSSCVLKASSGNLYSVYAECSAACWLMVFNKISAPSNGATTAGIAANGMQECIAISANAQGSISYIGGPPSQYSTGITAAISSTGCATLTLATTGFIHGVVR